VKVLGYAEVGNRISNTGHYLQQSDPDDIALWHSVGSSRLVDDGDKYRILQLSGSSGVQRAYCSFRHEYETWLVQVV